MCYDKMKLGDAGLVYLFSGVWVSLSAENQAWFLLYLLLTIKRKMTKMKESIKRLRTWCAVRLLLAVALMGIVFTACSDEDNNIVYSAGISTYHEAGEDALVNLRKVEKAYLEALNVSETPFILTGTVEECDAQVKAACERAQAEVEAMGLTGLSFTYVVTNQNTGKEVYSYTYEN